MAVKDHLGLDLSGASVAAVEKFQQALHAYHCYAGDAFTPLEAALVDSPGFVMGHVLSAYATLFGSNAELKAMGAQAFERAKTLPANAREQGHLAALGSILAGEIRAAARILEDVAIAYPQDTLALKVGQILDYLLGDSRMLRDRIGRVLPLWSESMPGYHAVLGLMAFGLEESGHYERAEAMGRRAIALEPRDNWAQHAVAHVLVTQGRDRDGIAWMRQENTAWVDESLLGVHNWWHTALFHLHLGETEEVLRLFDGPIWGAKSNFAFDLVDAAALLWRLRLKGVDVGDRFVQLAEVYATEPRGRNAFDDTHALIAFVGAGRESDARAVLEALTASARGSGDNALAAAQVGLPVSQAMHAFAHGDYARTVELLRGVRNRSALFGGSHAQRDLIDLTLIVAAGRSGEMSLERALLAERGAAQPLAPAARRLAA